MQRRREFLKTGVAAAGGLAFGATWWAEAVARPARNGPGPYGPLNEPDANGLMLPDGFTSRVVARGGFPVGLSAYVWHLFSDGAATFATPGGGWILVSNSEVPAAGGASAIRFSPTGTIESAYRILSGTSVNCAGGSTPWGTWLSGEEHEEGEIWECDPTGENAAKSRPALGVFTHEACAVDPVDSRVYLTEDEGDGGLYRFTPRRYGDLREGKLEIAMEPDGDGHVDWHRVPDPGAKRIPTRFQVPGSAVFKRGEGIFHDSGVIYVATTRDSKIHAYNTRNRKIRVIYNPDQLKNPPLKDVDNICASRSGDLFVCEDNGEPDGIDIAIITPGRRRRVARFLKATGSEHNNGFEDIASELAGVCFNPRGDRLYVASQRARLLGAVYEVSGPFRAGA
jgi:secreted PhoX family phosphatase